MTSPLNRNDQVSMKNLMYINLAFHAKFSIKYGSLS